MIAKELRGIWWKALIGVFLFVTVVINLIPYEIILRDASGAPTVGPDGLPLPEEFTEPIDPVEYAMQEMSFLYGVNGAWIVAILATFLGFSLVSGEVSRGSIFLLLARPITRSRILLTKYLVNAGTLLAVAALGALGLVLSAFLKEYPLGALSVAGFVLSTMLLWLGSLFVLSLAVLVSVVFRDVIVSAIATPFSLALALFFPVFLPEPFVSRIFRLSEAPVSPDAAERSGEVLILPIYWYDESLFVGESLAATNFLVCAIAAAVPLLVALWLFDRKAY